MDDYILCNSQSLLNDACVALKSSPRIILDCEGNDLGQQGGSLSLISLRTTTPSPSQTFLVDAAVLDDSTMRPLFDLLESSLPSKVVFDGRMDFNQLYHSHNITLTGVLDLQLVDITSRLMRGEDEDDQLKRLSPYLHRREVFASRNCYTQVQKLSGLGACLKEHAVEVHKDNSVSHKAKLWHRRPLTDTYLRYAARDVYAIDSLFNHFTKENYIDHDRLVSQSQRYITMWQGERTKSWDTFQNHGLLPLGILDMVFYPLKACKSCKRELPSECYSVAGWRLEAKRQCWVCRALRVKRNLGTQWARGEEDGW